VLLTAALPSLQARVASLGFPSFRAKQVHDYISRGVTDASLMTQLPGPLISSLLSATAPSSLSLASERVSSRDGTTKRAYRLPDGQLIESVLMPYSSRNTACVSSQAGCAMGCVFCATGQMGFSRQLSADEIYEQVAAFDGLVKRERGDKRGVTNVVFMGMGEPLANYRNVMAAARRMNAELGIGARKITVSTVGLPPMIRKLAKEPLQVNLAVSLHETNDTDRGELLPANKR
jgi:23S rRNA (adenine2503-C2)-methyltransferase